MLAYPAGEPDVLDLGLRHFVLVDQEGDTVLWWHDCPAVKHVAWGWIGRNGSVVSGHVVRSWSPLDVQGSLVCEHCRDHGFIRAGRWVPA